jgi:hypothetical protein
MNKGYLVGGLAIIGAVALFAYLRPKAPRRNSDGFFNAQGRRICVRTNPNGSVSQYTAHGDSRPCPYGGRVVGN